MFPGIVDTSSDDVTDVQADFEKSQQNVPAIPAIEMKDGGENSAEGGQTNVEVGQKSPEGEQKPGEGDKSPGVVQQNTAEAEQKYGEGTEKSGEILEQDALYQRRRRAVQTAEEKNKIQKRSRIGFPKGQKSLMDNPFWDIKMNTQDSIKSRSRIPAHPVKKQIMNGMLHKRWRIPGKEAVWLVYLLVFSKLS